MLIIGCLLVGLGIGVLWLAGLNHSSVESPVSEGIKGLSASTKTVLAGLSEPVEIRFYALLDPSSTPDALRAFASRAGRLVELYQHEAEGKIRLTRLESPGDAAAQAATADGLRPFNQDKGEACFLGIAILQKERKELLSELTPDWEPALESDLTRAISRVNQANRPLAPAPTPAASAQNSNTLAEIKRAIPDPNAMTLQEGKRFLRQENQKAFRAVAEQMHREIQAAQDRFRQVEQSASETEMRAARDEIQRLQSAQADKLKQIALQGQAQIAAWEELKANR